MNQGGEMASHPLKLKVSTMCFVDVSYQFMTFLNIIQALMWVALMIFLYSAETSSRSLQLETFRDMTTGL